MATDTIAVGAVAINRQLAQRRTSLSTPGIVFRPRGSLLE
jgi:hypothetical protein